ncbi:hypothetical protein ABOM_010240 [Aspergillus bombycis]|uniref:Stress-response A/B barrel domain-containing protein n=1 Tax=Aspergillus bombycis TaxID=109264 RepID=A0A1F7ZNM2_9EURO|nr:hypothetical protein ABOM_010240 [Aspergillus bombycis]OGM41056.1 hypothetical protein ABOM_010240 [Aspergillus bombycis]
MAVKHIVALRFKPSVHSATIAEATIQAFQRLLALKDGCILPTTNRPYIQSISGGQDMSIEGRQNLFTHAFVAEFDSVEDRDYYVREDPYHAEFARSLQPLIEDVQVLDFIV